MWLIYHNFILLYQNSLLLYKKLLMYYISFFYTIILLKNA